MDRPERQEIVIIGGGIIGCTTAYYLTRHPSFSKRTTITILEPSSHGAAHGASGKAGGLVAKWAYPAKLAALSFEEHNRLAAEHDGAKRWGWRQVECGTWRGRAREPDAGSDDDGPNVTALRKSLGKTNGLAPGPLKAGRLPSDLEWVQPDLTESYSAMGPTGSSAQVHPYQFTNSMLALARDCGVRFVRARADEIIFSSGAVSGVNYTSFEQREQKKSVVSATHVILAAGAWSPTLLPELSISGTRAHSITISPPPMAHIAPYVLFTEIALPGGGTADPEVYARPDGEVYACGPTDDSPLPAGVDDVEVDRKACDALQSHVASVSCELRDGHVRTRQACYLPTVRGGGGPIIGEATKIAQNLFVATGHTCWGICNAPGTAKALAELIMEGKIRCIDLPELAPSGFT